MKIFSKNLHKQQQGFTIIELMIALSVLSVLLLMSTVLLIQIGKMYSKGVNMSNVQNSSRNIINDLSSALEFGGTSPMFGEASYAPTLPTAGDPVTVKSICFDTRRYSYIVGEQLSTTPVYHPSDGSTPQTYHVLWQDTMQTNANCFPMDITRPDPGNPPSGVATVDKSGRELVPVRSRLSTLNLQENPGGSGIFTLDVGVIYGDNDLLNGTGTLCNNDAGQEYCASSILDTVVTRRLK